MSKFADLFIPVPECEPFSEIVPWGVPRGSVTALVGPPEAGKTTLADTLAFLAASKEKGNLLIFDTETNKHVHYALLETLEENHKIPVNVIMSTPVVKNTGSKDKPKWEVEWNLDGKFEKDVLNAVIVYCTDIEPILDIHGRGAEVEIMASGKVMARHKAGSWISGIENTPIGEFIRENKVKAVVYDSLTNPNDEIITSPANLPSRSDMTQLWLIQIQKLAASLDLPVFATLHESKNESDPFHPALKAEGGKGILYNVKVILYMMRDKNNALIPAGSPIKDTLKTLPFSCRYLIPMRAPKTTPWSKAAALEITPQGIKPTKVG